ncbi:FAD-binding oxidoreductase [Streptomyces sp. NPDC058326]|uniref:FAD-binding oxidoreductase n=1 Tax=Streptomyces sp. NPDC058326 TaxID=3346447 RepID=UPI0036E3CAB3
MPEQPDPAAPRLTRESPELAELLTAVRGQVMFPGSEGFDEELSGYQTYVRNRPDIVVGVDGVDDVRAAVAFAAEHDLAISVQATGHGMAYAAEGGLLISTRRMNDVHIDPRARTARVAAGASWRQVIEQAAEHGLAPLSGSFPDVCAVSYVLGGGLGLVARQYGYAADHVRSLDIVTGNGELLRTGPETQPELFWALRGGGGNFGVVTSMEVDLFPITSLYGGRLVFDTPHVEDAMNAFHAWAQDCPEEMTGALKLVQVPNLEPIPALFRGKFLAIVLIAYNGDPAEAERVVEPLRAVGPRLVDALAPVPYTESGSIHDEPEEPHVVYGNSFMLSDLNPATVKAILDTVGADAPASVMTEIRQLGGAVARDPATPNAVSHRDAAYALRVISALEDVGMEVARPVHERLDEALAPWTMGRSLNFVHSDGRKPSEDQVRSLWSKQNYERLARIKAAHDPRNLFRFNFNVPPASEAAPHN